MYRDTLSWEMKMRHDISTNFDLLRHYVAYEWDQIWSDTIGRVERGVATVEKWFRGLPPSIKSLLSGLGKMLLGIGTGSMKDFLSGLKQVGGSILSWIKGFFGGIPHFIMSFLHMSPPHPGSAFYDLGANFMHHMEVGMKSSAGRVTGAAGSIASMVAQVLKASGKPMSWLPAITRLVGLESGGNARAVNPISVGGQHAEGMFQMLPSTFYANGGRGSLFNWLGEGIAAMRYISATYGSPFNIPGLFSGGYRGYATGGIISEPIFGLGLHSGMKYGFGENGIREKVTPLGSGGGGGDVYNIYPPESATNPDAYALTVIQSIRKYKMRHGNAVVGIA
jgi:hypothetical protein